ncbi:hypothetical protein C8J57DRAFT_1477117 [Mycena rebaudengoi]|nr:hypothetical protein C8J57DRAFT_1477117 [Mycena rebaudengoi]
MGSYTKRIPPLLLAASPGVLSGNADLHRPPLPNAPVWWVEVVAGVMTEDGRVRVFAVAVTAGASTCWRTIFLGRGRVGGRGSIGGPEAEPSSIGWKLLMSWWRKEDGASMVRVGVGGDEGRNTNETSVLGGPTIVDCRVPRTWRRRNCCARAFGRVVDVVADAIARGKEEADGVTKKDAEEVFMSSSSYGIKIEVNKFVLTRPLFNVVLTVTMLSKGQSTYVGVKAPGAVRYQIPCSPVLGRFQSDAVCQSSLGLSCNRGVSRGLSPDPGRDRTGRYDLHVSQHLFDNREIDA